nr:hypothetical protein CFP56_21602 [Quercus suber]
MTRTRDAWMIAEAPALFDQPSRFESNRGKGCDCGQRDGVQDLMNQNCAPRRSMPARSLGQSKGEEMVDFRKWTVGNPRRGPPSSVGAAFEGGRVRQCGGRDWSCGAERGEGSATSAGDGDGDGVNDDERWTTGDRRQATGDGRRAMAMGRDIAAISRYYTLDDRVGWQIRVSIGGRGEARGAAR